MPTTSDEPAIGGCRLPSAQRSISLRRSSRARAIARRRAATSSSLIRGAASPWTGTRVHVRPELACTVYRSSDSSPNFPECDIRAAGNTACDDPRYAPCARGYSHAAALRTGASQRVPLNEGLAVILDEPRRSLRPITAQREQTARRVAAKLGLSLPVADRQ
jgi:hypothetical protein